MPQKPTQHSERIALTEVYDRTNGFILDAFVDQTPARSSLLPRPSITVNVDLGGVSPSGMPATTSGAFLDEFRVFPIPYQSGTFAVAIYHTSDASNQYYAMAMWEITGPTLLGSLYLGAVTTINNVGTAGLFDLPNPLQHTVAGSIAIVSGGSGYAPLDTVVFVGGTPAVAPLLLTVLTVDGSGKILTFSVGRDAIYGTVPPNPIATTTSGAGTGATFSATWFQAYGMCGYPAANPLSAETAFIGISTSNVTQFVTTFLPAIRALDPKKVTTLNNFAFILDPTLNVWNTNVGDVTTVNGLAFTQAFTLQTTKPVSLASHSTYILSMGSDEIRLFYITGTTVGSAISPIQPAKYDIGCFSDELVANVNETLCLCGAPDKFGVPVYMFPANSQVPQRISYPYVEQTLSQYTLTTGGMLTWGGHFFYCINTTTTVSFLYDIVTKYWLQWTPFAASAQFALTSTSVFANLTYGMGFDTGVSQFYMLGFASPSTDENFNGNEIVYTPTLTTQVLDFGSEQQKQFESVTFIGDQTSTALVATLQYSDNTGQTWSNPRSVALNSDHPWTKNLGQGRRRRLRVTIPADPSVRIDALQVNFNVGSQ